VDDAGTAQTDSGTRVQASTSEICLAASDDIWQLSQELERMRLRAEAAESLSEDLGKETVASDESWRQHQDELEIWKQHSATTPVQLSKRPYLIPVMYKVLQSLVHSSHDCVRARRVMLTSVEEVINVRQWKKYCHHRELTRDTLKTRMECPWAADEPPVKMLSEALSWLSLDHMANEVVLLHGCHLDIAEKIARQGFDERMCKRCFYGHGVYLTTDFCKALQYCDPGPSKCILVARVILGHPYFAKGAMDARDRPPEAEGHGVPHDSIIARPGIPRRGRGWNYGREGAYQIHWEFVIPRGDLQIYPELLIRFRARF